MSQINPLAHVVFQSIEVQRKAAVQKERQLRRATALEKDMAAQDEFLEHHVESTDEVQAAGDEAEHEKQRRKRHASLAADEEGINDEENPHIDLTA